MKRTGHLMGVFNLKRPHHLTGTLSDLIELLFLVTPSHLMKRSGHLMKLPSHLMKRLSKDQASSPCLAPQLFFGKRSCWLGLFTSLMLLAGSVPSVFAGTWPRFGLTTLQELNWELDPPTMGQDNQPELNDSGFRRSIEPESNGSDFPAGFNSRVGGQNLFPVPSQWRFSSEPGALSYHFHDHESTSSPRSLSDWRENLCLDLPSLEFFADEGKPGWQTRQLKWELARAVIDRIKDPEQKKAHLLGLIETFSSSGQKDLLLGLLKRYGVGKLDCQETVPDPFSFGEASSSQLPINMKSVFEFMHRLAGKTGDQGQGDHLRQVAYPHLKAALDAGAHAGQTDLVMTLLADYAIGPVSSYVGAAIDVGARAGQTDLVMALLEKYLEGLGHPYLRVAIESGARSGQKDLVLALLEQYGLGVYLDDLHVALNEAAKVGQAQLVLALLEQYGMGADRCALYHALSGAIDGDQLSLVCALFDHYVESQTDGIDSSVLRLRDSVFRKILLQVIEEDKSNLFFHLTARYSIRMTAYNLDLLLEVLYKKTLFVEYRRQSYGSYVKLLLDYARQQAIPIDDALQVDCQGLLARLSKLDQSIDID